MDADFIAFYENTCRQLRNSFTSPNSYEVEMSEKILKSLSEQYDQFLEILSVIITTEKNEENLRLSASLYFVSSLKSKLKTMNSSNMARKLYYINVIFQLISNDSLSLRIKRTFISVLTEILECDLDEKLMLEILDKASKKTADVKNLPIFMAGLLALLSLYQKKSHSNLEIMDSCFKEETLPKFLEMIIFIVPNLKIFCSNLNNPNFISNNSIDLKWLEILSLIGEILELYLKSYKDRKDDYIKFFFENFQITKSFLEVINLFSIENKEVIISSIINQDILKNLISSKVFGFKCLNILIQNYFNDEHNLEKFPYVLEFFGGILEEKLQQLINYFENHNNILCILNGEDRLEINELLYEYFFFVSNMAQSAKIKKIYQIFSNKKEKLIIEILLPLMLTTKEELKEYIENPSEFVNNSTKITETFNLESLKSNSANILSTICLKIDGALTYLSQSLLENLKLWLQNKDSEEKIRNSFFFSNKISLEKKVETTLFTFSVLSHLVLKREDLLNYLEDIFHEYFDTLVFHTNSKIIKSRICLFCSYYIFHLFIKNNVHRYLYLFQFIFDCLNESTENRTIVLQSIETLNYLFIDNSDFERMKNIINQLLGTLKKTYTIERIDEYSFFDFLANAIKNYNMLIKKEVFDNLIASMIKRIQIEMTEKINQNKNILESCFNNLLLICEDDYVLEHFIEVFEENFVPLCELLHNENFIDSYDVILSIFFRFIEGKKAIPNFLFQDLKVIPIVFNNNKNSFKNLFQIINQILLYGKNFIKININLLEIFLNIAYLGMENKINDELNQIKAALIIHLLIQNFTEYIHKETLLNIFQKTSQTLTNFSETEYSYLTYFEIFQLGIIYFPEITIEYLLLTQKINTTFEKISKINYVSCFNYDIQIFILTFCSMLIHANFETLSSNLFKKIFALAVETQGFHHLKKKNSSQIPKVDLEKKRKLEKNAMTAEIEFEENKEDNGNSMNNNSDSFDFSDKASSTNSFNFQFDHPDKNFERLLRNFMCPIKQENEIQYFQETIKKLKEEKMSLYNIFMKEISEQQKSIFYDILSLKKIEDSAENKDHKYRKIIKTKGRKQTNIKNLRPENKDMEYTESLYPDFKKKN